MTRNKRLRYYFPPSFISNLDVRVAQSKINNTDATATNFVMKNTLPLC